MSAFFGEVRFVLVFLITLSICCVFYADSLAYQSSNSIAGRRHDVRRGKKRDKSDEIPEDCSECGARIFNEPDTKFLIPGGTEVKYPNKYPWIVSIRLLGLEGKNHCGGSIISADMILTAAHCVMEDDGPNYHRNIFFQTSSSSKLDKGPPIEKIFVHPKYNLVPSKTTDVTIAEYDIALIKLKSKIKCNKYRNAICLPWCNKLNLPLNFTSIIAGWGSFGRFEKQQEKLHEGRIKRLDFSKCIEAVPETTMIKNYALCLGGTKQTACYGDSGSPLFREKNNSKRFYVFGIASSETDTGCPSNKPNVYMNVKKFRHWIHEHMQKAKSDDGKIH